MILRLWCVGCGAVPTRSARHATRPVRLVAVVASGLVAVGCSQAHPAASGSASFGDHAHLAASLAPTPPQARSSRTSSGTAPGTVSVRSLVGIAFAHPLNGFALVRDTRDRIGVAITGDGGRRWTRVGQVAFNGPWWRWALTASAHLDAVWGPAGLFLSGDGGRSWQHRLRVPVGQVAVQADAVWATIRHCPPKPRASGRRGGCRANLVASADAGRHWRVRSRVPLAAVTPQADGSYSVAHQLIRVSPTTGYLLDPVRAGILLVTTDGGRNWTRHRGPCRSRPLRFGVNGPYYAVAADGTQVWVACGGEPGAGNQAKAVYVSRDAGATWQPTAATARRHSALPSGYLDGLVLPTPHLAYLVLSRFPLQRSTDGGEHWAATIKPLDVAGQDVTDWARVNLSVLGRRAWALVDGAPNVWATADGGRHWRPLQAR